LLGNRSYKNTTFAHSGPFFLNQESINDANRIKYLTEVILLCGGVMTENKSKAKLIISDAPTSVLNRKQTVVLKSFVFDSAMKGVALDTARFAPKP
jgi:BRCT domain, a BRCA1 C-terminus domain